MKGLRVAVAAILASTSCAREAADSAPSAQAALEGAPAAASGETSATRADTMPRKIIRDAQASVTVQHSGDFVRSLERAVTATGGYVASKQVGGVGNGEWGDISLRVPADKLDSVLETLTVLGTVESESVKAQDISAEYYDVTARLKNERVLEARLLRLVDERTGRLADVVDAEAKLAAVREQIEQLEGRQRLWDSQVALATVRISFRAAPSPETLSYVASLRRSFASSVHGMRELGRGASLAGVALAPWAVLGAACVLPIRMLRRRRRAAA
jgi:hypothetical protein